jgi:integrase/recombinase XerD
MSDDESVKRTPPKVKARHIAKLLRPEKPDYNYLREIFRHLRRTLAVKVVAAPKRLPHVPTEEEVKRYYEAVWEGENIRHILVIKTFLYTGVRVSELVNIKLDDVNLAQCQIRINDGKGGKDRVVPFPQPFKVALAVHMEAMRKNGASHLFVSSWGRPYSDRGIRKVMESYTEKAGLKRPISPHKLRHFLLTWMKKRGIDDALIQPYSGHASRKSLEVYSKLAIADAQKGYDEAIKEFPV